MIELEHKKELLKYYRRAGLSVVACTFSMGIVIATQSSKIALVALLIGFVACISTIYHENKFHKKIDLA